MNLLEIKQRMKKKRPVIRRVEKHRRKSLPDNWRKPKGHHSKIRRGLRWEMKMPLIGRRTPAALRGADKQGREVIMISSVEDLQLLDKNKVGVVKGRLGLKKKALIAEKIKGRDYKIINLNVESVLKKAEEKKAGKKPIKTAGKVEKEVKKPVKTPAEKPVKKPVKKPAKPKKGGKS